MNDDRDLLLQDLLDGSPRPATALDDEARRELAAYKLVYKALGDEPPSYLPDDFAERLTRVAFARDDFGLTFWLLTGLLVLFGLGVSAVSMVLLLPADSVLRGVARGLVTQGADLAPVWNAGSVVVTLVVAFLLDRVLSRDN